MICIWKISKICSLCCLFVVYSSLVMFGASDNLTRGPQDEDDRNDENDRHYGHRAHDKSFAQWRPQDGDEYRPLSGRAVLPLLACWVPDVQTLADVLSRGRAGHSLHLQFAFVAIKTDAVDVLHGSREVGQHRGVICKLGKTQVW